MKKSVPNAGYVQKRVLLLNARVVDIEFDKIFSLPGEYFVFIN
jgi:hypothetical protein